MVEINEIQQTPVHLSKAKEDFLREGTKGLIFINSIAILTLFLFLSTVWNDPKSQAMIYSIVTGIYPLITGTATAALIHVVRHIAWVTNHTHSPQFWYVLANRIMPIWSALCFVAGMLFVVEGITPSF